MQASTAEITRTIDDLLAAFEGESNARAKYIAFAAKADAEGWHGAASLFRAAVRAEQVHAANHARVIQQLGGNPKCVIHPVDVRGTFENLTAALAGEKWEVDSMYSAFLADAERQGNIAVARTFQWALESEKTHVRLFGEAACLVEAGNKDAWTGSVRSFYVCTECGYTLDDPDAFKRCPVCNLALQQFEMIR
jgi:rubrerythrin